MDKWDSLNKQKNIIEWNDPAPFLTVQEYIVSKMLKILNYQLLRIIKNLNRKWYLNGIFIMTFFPGFPVSPGCPCCKEKTGFIFK